MPRPYCFLLLLIAAAACFIAASAAAQQPAASTRVPWTTSRIHGAPTPPEPYKIVSAFPSVRFDKPTSIEEIPTTGRLLVTERDGKVFTFPKDKTATQPDPVLNLKDLLPADLAGQNVSLFDAELHSQFADNHYLFLMYVHPGEGGHSRLSRFKLTDDAAPKAIPGSEQVILTWPSGGHNAGCLEFGTDGFLYIATGDGSGPNPPDGLTTGQDVSDLLGAILRIDVREPGNRLYAIPASNPFVKQPGARGEIWAYGLRNPWKIGIDPQTGDIYAADNGWETWELVHKIVRGGNCGWPVMEGRARLRSEVPVGPTPIRPPVKDHPHTEANSVIGGPVYRGQKLSELNGAFVYGDYITGTIWSLHPEQDGSYTHATLVDTDQRIVAFTQTAAGELYVLDYDVTGQIYELLPSGAKDNTADFPRTLSVTGLFTSVKTLDPAPGVVPYSIKVQPWMDGAVATRWAAIPADGQITLTGSTNEPSSYPDGTVLVKHLSLPQPGRESIRLETQLLHYEDGTWRPYSYVWDESGQEATLVDSLGINRSLRLADPVAEGGVSERMWRVNATNECKLCHNAGPRFVLGFVPNQLESSQLASLTSLGILTSQSVQSPDNSLHLVNPPDQNESLHDRARSYLHVNCAMCHHPGGNAIVSFFLRRDLPFDKLNTNKGTNIGTFGMPEAKIIASGDPCRSVLLYRMSKLGYARMPYIGSRVVDSAGVTLIHDWIRSLPSDSSPPAERNTSRETFAHLTAPQTTAAQRTLAIKSLLASTPSALSLLVEMHRGSLRGEAQIEAVALGTRTTTSDIRGLFETFLPESQRRATLGANFDPKLVLTAPGDIARGKLIFSSDAARCRACHDATDRAASLGPTLQEINKKYPIAADMLTHVINPSQKIEDAYIAYAVQTHDGQAHTGLLASDTNEEITLKTADKKLLRIPRSEIAALQKSTKSLMPDQVLSDLTAQEAADLLAYLRSLGPGNQ